MDHRIDKNRSILKELSSCPSYIKIQRFSGIKATDFLSYNVHSYITPGSKIHMGIIGCWMAHKNVIKYFADNQYLLEDDEWVLILEDDIFINTNFWNYISNIQPIHDADMIFFDTIKSPIDPKYIIDHELQISHIFKCSNFQLELEKVFAKIK